MTNTIKKYKNKFNPSKIKDNLSEIIPETYFPDNEYDDSLLLVFLKYLDTLKKSKCIRNYDVCYDYEKKNKKTVIHKYTINVILFPKIKKQYLFSMTTNPVSYYEKCENE